MPRIDPTIYTPAGNIAVHQANVGDWEISYNPDTRRYHVDDPTTQNSVRTYTNLRNARAWAKTNPRPHDEGSR